MCLFRQFRIVAVTGTSAAVRCDETDPMTGRSPPRRFAPETLPFGWKSRNTDLLQCHFIVRPNLPENHHASIALPVAATAPDWLRSQLDDPRRHRGGVPARVCPHRHGFRRAARDPRAGREIGLAEGQSGPHRGRGYAGPGVFDLSGFPQIFNLLASTFPFRYWRKDPPRLPGESSQVPWPRADPHYHPKILPACRVRVFRFPGQEPTRTTIPRSSPLAG